jgi:hypothetical protein
MKRYGGVLHWLAMLGLVGHVVFLTKDWWGYQEFYTRAPDWYYHADRIKSILNNGTLESWTLKYYGGIAPWKGYQFVPHFLTAWFAYGMQGFGWSISRSMVVVASFLLVFNVILTYWIQYKLSHSKSIAFLAGMSLPILFSVWNNFARFSSLFGFTWFLLLIFGWLYIKNPAKRLLGMSFLTGLAVFVHPLALVCCLGLWFDVMWKFIKQTFDKQNIFSQKKLIDILLVSVSVLWVVGLIFVFGWLRWSDELLVSPYLLNNAFLWLLLGQESLEYFLMLFFGVVVMFGLVWGEEDEDNDNFWSSKSRVMMVVGYSLLGIAVLSLFLPSNTLKALQVVRTGFFQVFLVGSVVLAKWGRNEQKSWRDAVLWVCILVIVMGGGIWTKDRKFYGFEGVDAFPNPVYEYGQEHGIKGTVILEESIFYGKFATEGVSFTQGYHQHALSSFLGVRLDALLGLGIGQQELLKDETTRFGLIESYAKTLGVEVIFLPKFNRMEEAFRAKWEFMGEYEGGYEKKFLAFRVPWQVRNGAQITDEQAQELKNLVGQKNVYDKNKLDEFATKFAGVLYDEQNISLNTIRIDDQTLYLGLPQKGQIGIYTYTFSTDFKTIKEESAKVSIEDLDRLMIKNQGIEKVGILVRHFW